jgi:hypothetical protein
MLLIKKSIKGEIKVYLLKPGAVVIHDQDGKKKKKKNLIFLFRHISDRFLGGLCLVCILKNYKSGLLLILSGANSIGHYVKTFCFSKYGRGFHFLFSFFF